MTIRNEPQPTHRTAVIAIDLQSEFIGADALFPVPDGERLVAEAVPFLSRMRELGIPVIFTAFAVPDARPLGRSTARFGNPRAHRYPDAALLPGLDIDERDIVIEKSRQSAFVGTGLDLLLRRLGADHLVILGVTTHSCCLATAIDAAALDFDVTVLSDLTACPPVPAKDGLPPMTADEAHTAALQLVAYSSAQVATSADVLDALRPELAR
ncbi:cysteine hydrolase [Microbacterium sp. 179-I 3D3 NHS]|uniref:cysteine hydrolase n=1 Tax=Microbacterium sp. 179-I 3D3 NHS TaxID=3142382 RepID=UPI0039A0FEE7